MPFRSLCLALLLVLVSSARADWEAVFNAQSSRGSFPRAAGKFYSKIDRFRVDTNVPVEMSLYVKSGSSRVEAAIPSFRMRLTSDLEKFSAQVPACLSRSFEDCVKRFGLKKTGEAACGEGGDPRTCEIFSGDGKGLKDVKKIEIRHWKGEKEPILASSVVTKKDGDVITTTFAKISRKSHDEAFYAVPAGYVNAGSLDKFLGDFKGGSE
ncbi:MAG: hypothetical protein JST04_11290 [Bdellovibrionales bacterium]|nr:hypothetical protein [Bdellovibrionales bacterium]